MKIVMLESLNVPEEVLRNHAAPLERAGHEVILCTQKLSEEEKLSRAAGAEAFIIANGKLSPELIQAAPELKLISVGFTGVDHVPLELCRERGIRVCNAQGYATEATAELALGLMLSCLRQIPALEARARSGGTIAGMSSGELRGRTVGIVGTGAIGSRVAELVTAFGCSVLAFSRHADPALEARGVRYVSMEELFSRSDIVSLHVPLNSMTRGMISRERLASMKPGAILINCSRGPVVDSRALAEALNEGRIAAGLDVFDMEPPLPAEEPLLTAKNTVLTPHAGYYTREAMAVRAEIVFENVAAFLRGEPQNVKV
ncbi:MAG: hydroxyacid dehydrogenase [Oscillospiraceae bacterium]|nr:hydroxyacid dehydrogenase [Oscillospiraceae bacterium]